MCCHPDPQSIANYNRNAYTTYYPYVSFIQLLVLNIVKNLKAFFRDQLNMELPVAVVSQNRVERCLNFATHIYSFFERNGKNWYD